MKMNRSVLYSFLLLLAIAALYRVMPGRPFGFAPQLAMALFAGSVTKNRKYAFLLPLFSMLLSDILYEVLYLNGLSNINGFYEGQWVNYLVFIGLTTVGFLVKKEKWLQIIAGSFASAVLYFFVSNFLTWAGGGLDINNMPYPKTFNGLMSCLEAGIPFFRNSLVSTLLFSGVLFGGYQLIGKFSSQKTVVA